eukprot:TRINITY_DN81908_c0_g1_i1.p1 TRINITY_DN81908_c0_g1~~TRINITY_DN81908_c0_g1_i1.p1  ORF type:complete len:479 (+),score=119.71 TRINITY_DN81908_c0_g1_i1:100-1437(+)
MASDRMSQAVALEKKARELENQGQLQAAFQEYRNCLAIFEFVYKWENNPRVKDMVRERIEELVERAEKLKTSMSQPKAAPAPAPAGGGGGGYNGAAAAQAPPATGTQQESEEDKEKAALRKNLEGAIMTSKPNIKWDDVAGLQGAKDALQETVILPTTFPQLFVGKREPWHGILLYGPPGTGKSFLAKACATEADATFFSISSSDLVSKWMGESERLVRQLFEMAREAKPAIIFIDEVDSLCGARGESGESDAARRIKTEFLAQMDGVGKSKANLLVLGATNTPWDLDTAIRRRFEKRVYIPLPEEEARVVMLRLNIGDTPSQINEEEMRQIARRADGFSGADMSILTRDALFEPVRRCQRAKTFQRVQKAGPDGVMRQHWTPCSPGAPGATEMSLMQVPKDELLPPVVTAADFEAALDKCRPSVSQGDLKQYEDWTATFGTEGD